MALVENLWKTGKGRHPFGFGVPFVFGHFDGLEFVVVEVDLHCLIDVEFFGVIGNECVIFDLAFLAEAVEIAVTYARDIPEDRDVQPAADRFDLVELVRFLAVLGRVRGHQHVAVMLHAGAGGDQASHDDVLLEAPQVVHAAGDGRLGEHPRRLLEGSRGDERIGRERRLRDAEQQRLADGRLPTLVLHAAILVVVTEPVHLLLHEEIGIPHFADLYPPHHLPDDHLDVLIVNLHALQPVHLLDLVPDVILQCVGAQHTQNVVRVQRSVHQRFTGPYAVALLHVDVCTTRDVVFPLGPVIARDDDLPLTLGDRPELNGTVNLGHHRGFTRTTGFEQLDHTRETADDVFRLGGLARDLRDDIAGGDLLPVLDHQVRTDRHLVRLERLVAFLDLQPRLVLLVRVLNDQALLPRHLVDLLLDGLAFLQVLVLDRALHLREDRERERIPRHEHVVLLHLLPVLHMQLRTVNHLVPRNLAPAVILDRDLRLSLKRYHFARTVLDDFEVIEIPDSTVHGRQVFGLLFQPGRSSNVEGSHGQLGSRLSNRL